MTVKEKDRLAIAVQKSGRLNEKSLALLGSCGLQFDAVKWKEKLVLRCADFPVDLMMVRDDDIPEYVASGTCEMGIVGENVLEERSRSHGADGLEVLRKLGFGRCRLSLAVPAGAPFDGPRSLDGKRVATSYPGLLGAFLEDQAIRAEVVTLSGSVEIAPSLHIADAVCDLVSTGSTLHSNGLREVLTVFESQAVLIGTRRALPAVVAEALRKVLVRVDGVRQAARSKYIMMNAPKSALPAIQKIIPGMEEPSIMPLGTSGERIAIHAVAREDVFWDTIERLKAVGATSILVLPIEKIIA
ncbi:MAG TPA: ATP phosphoribosyltransferase [Elusimicrobiota bacterium]|nr:ATP phosphoribosyltransferase [Elusimicrobiota bacterium]